MSFLWAAKKHSNEIHPRQAGPCVDHLTHTCCRHSALKHLGTRTTKQGGVHRRKVRPTKEYETLRWPRALFLVPSDIPSPTLLHPSLSPPCSFHQCCVLGYPSLSECKQEERLAAKASTSRASALELLRFRIKLYRSGTDVRPATGE